MTPQQKIAERIYELLPRKKELEFGCRVSFNRGHGLEYGTYLQDIGLFEVINPDDYSYGIFQITNGSGNAYKVIGQPIRLADILMAINKYTDEGIYVLDDGTFADREDIVLGDYNLSKDNILEQSDEFCEFLLELLN